MIIDIFLQTCWFIEGNKSLLGGIIECLLKLMTKLSRKATIFFEQYRSLAGLERERAEGRAEERWEKKTEEREGRGRTPPPWGSPGPGIMIIYVVIPGLVRRGGGFFSLFFGIVHIFFSLFFPLP